jgi:hypothetical protein
LARSLRRVVGALTCLLVGVAAAVGLAGPAHAEDGYRYWNYSHLEDGSWAFSQVGPAEHQPKDGAVEGFRFGTSTVSQGLEPRADLDEVTFDAVCAGTEAGADQKRVAVLIDYGTEQDAGAPPQPRAACAAVEAGATTQQILQQVAEVRQDSGMTCGIDGYPATGCGEPVPNATVATDEEPVAFTGTAQQDATSQSGLPWTLVAVAVLVVLLATAALLLARRKRAA